MFAHVGSENEKFAKISRFCIGHFECVRRQGNFALSQLSFTKKYHQKILAILAVYMDVDAFSPLQTPSYIADMFVCMSVVRVSGTVFPWPP